MVVQRHIVHVISSMAIGGAETVLCDIVRGLNVTSLYRHTVIYFHEGPLSKQLCSLGISVYRVTGVVCLYDPIFWWRIYRRVRQANPDLIHASLWSAGFVSRLMGKWLNVPVVTAVHAQLEHHGAVRNFLDRMTIGSRDRFIAVTDEVSVAMQRYIPALRSASIVSIANGVDIERLDAKQNIHPVDRAQYGLLPEHIVLGSVGRFVPVKQYDLLLEMCAKIAVRYEHARLMLVGVGPLEMSLRALASQYSIADRVIFIVGQDAAPLYSLMDIFVQPSRSEGLSMALLEAMASRLPVVVTGSQGFHPVITHGLDGILIDPHNGDQFLSQIELLIRDISLRKILGRAARASVIRSHSTVAMISGYQKTFSDIIDNPS